MPKRHLYSRADETQTADGRRPGQYPEFELDYGESQDGREITIFDDTAGPFELRERWLSIDARHAVPLGEVA